MEPGILILLSIKHQRNFKFWAKISNPMSPSDWGPQYHAHWDQLIPDDLVLTSFRLIIFLLPHAWPRSGWFSDELNGWSQTGFIIITIIKYNYYHITTSDDFLVTFRWLSVILSDGIGFFILHGDILRTLFSLLAHSTAFMSFSGWLYFYLRKRMQVMKKVEKGHKRLKIWFY